MKYKTSMISILLTFVIIICGLYLPSLDFSRQNRNSLLTPKTYEIASPNLYYSVSFSTMMQVFYAGSYKLMLYNSAESLHLRHTEKEIRSQVENIMKNVFKQLYLTLPADDSLQNFVLTPCLVANESGSSDSSSADEDITYAYSGQATDSASDDFSDDIKNWGSYELPDDVSFFVWKYEVYFDGMAVTFYMDDINCKVVAFEINHPDFFSEKLMDAYYSLTDLLSTHYRTDNHDAYPIWNKKTNSYSSVICYFSYGEDIDRADDPNTFTAMISFNDDRFSMNL